MSEVKLLNMCMVCDKESGRVVVLDKINSNWNGITFPGGHVEEGESIVESTIREIREETGLQIKNLELSGLVHWYYSETKERRLVFLYKTYDYSGALHEGTQEGKVFWVDYDKLESMPLSDGFGEYLKIYNKNTLSEAFATWDSQNESDFRLL